MVLYKIRDWDAIYENNRTRNMVDMRWLPLPIKLDGDGYGAIMELEDGPAIFGAFIAILEVAAKCSPRGELWRGAGFPHDARTLSRKTRMHPAVIGQCLEFCSCQDCNWLESQELEQGCRMGAGWVPDGCRMGAGKLSLQDRTGQDKTGEEITINTSDCKTEVTWRTNTEEGYRLYIDAHDKEYSRLLDDTDAMARFSKFYPRHSYLLSMDHAREYWGAVDGWKKKRASKAKTIDWGATYRKSLDQDWNRIWASGADTQPLSSRKLT